MGSQMRSGASAAACSTLTNKASGSDTLMLGIMKLQERLEHKSRFLKRGQALPGHRETRFAESQELPGSAAAPGAGSHQPPLIHVFHPQPGRECLYPSPPAPLTPILWEASFGPERAGCKILGRKTKMLFPGASKSPELVPYPAGTLGTQRWDTGWDTGLSTHGRLALSSHSLPVPALVTLVPVSPCPRHPSR